MTRLRFHTLIVLILFSSITVESLAVSFQPFEAEAFADLRQNGALVLIDIGAPWCSTCAKQKKILQSYAADRTDVELAVLSVDFDTQKDWVRRFRARRQSTLILFSGDKPLWFSVAETRKSIIYENLDKGFSGLSETTL